MYYLYKKDVNVDITYINNDFIKECTLEVFMPKCFNLKAQGEDLGFKALIARLIFFVSTKGKMKVYFLKKDGKIIHTSNVISKCRKFPFMSKSDLEIGPCNTKSGYRRRGCYLYVLQYILSCEHTFDNGCFYMIVNEKKQCINRWNRKSWIQKNW